LGPAKIAAPFTTFLTNVPAEGKGLNPLLQNYWMAIHPPSLYTGFVGMTIPFAFCIAALATGHLDDSWLRAVRRWTMFAWLFLSIGLFLGMIWAYEELGWGGYWMWDPVENAALLPWFTATAFLHSVMVQERRSMLRIWNVTLVITTFFLTIFGTFMTRSGIVESVHAFGDDPMLAQLFTIFMVAILVFSFGLVIYRLPLLKARNELDSWASREAAFMVNNWILLFSAFFVLFGTMFPTLSEAVTGNRLTVAGPFFNKWMTPIALVLLFLTGAGPLLAWRKSTLSNLAYQFMWPAIACLGTAAALAALGIRVWASGICFSLCALVAATITQEFFRGANIRRRNTGTDIFTALVGLVGRNKRRYGGYIVHVGVVLAFFGIAGSSAYKKETVQELQPGGVLEQLHRIESGGQACPEEHATPRRVPGRARRHVAAQRGLHRIALRAIAHANRRHVLVEEPVAHDFVHHALVEARRVQVRCLLGLQQLGHQLHRRHDVAEAKARRQHFGKRAEVDAALGPPRGHRGRRRRVEPQVAVGVVFDQRHSGGARRVHQRLTPCMRDHAAGGVLKIRQQVGEARTRRPLRQCAEGFRQRPVVVTVERHEVGLVRGECLQRAEIGGGLDRHRRAQDEAAFLNVGENGPVTPGPDVKAARWLADA
jgi:c-type cytochrome biogenesis protein CcmF